MLNLQLTCYTSRVNFRKSIKFIVKINFVFVHLYKLIIVLTSFFSKLSATWITSNQNIQRVISIKILVRGRCWKQTVCPWVTLLPSIWYHCLFTCRWSYNKISQHMKWWGSDAWLRTGSSSTCMSPRGIPFASLFRFHQLYHVSFILKRSWTAIAFQCKLRRCECWWRFSFLSITFDLCWSNSSRRGQLFAVNKTKIIRKFNNRLLLNLQ